jgi:hypothetical protein
MKNATRSLIGPIRAKSLFGGGYNGTNFEVLDVCVITKVGVLEWCEG